MRDLKTMATMEVMAFSEVIISMLDELDRTGRIAAVCAMDEGITEEELTLIHTRLEQEVKKLEPTRLKIVKEMSRRLQHNFDIKSSPDSVEKLIVGMTKKYKYLGLSKTEIEIAKAKEIERQTLKDNTGNMVKV